MVKKTLIAPGVHIYTAQHPLDADEREMDETGHPHSWNLVDADDCVKWMLQYIK